MYLKCERDLLLENINLAQRAVSNKSTMPIFESILLKCDESGFRLFATDQEIAIKTICIDCEILELGAVALPSRFFSEIIRKLPVGTVSIKVEESFVVKIKCNSSEFKIVGLNPDEFPEIEEIEKDFSFNVNQGEFKNLIKRTVFSVSQDTAKPNLMGSYIELSGNDLKMVTCDAYRVSFATGSFGENEGARDGGVIVPYKAISEMLRLLGDDENMSVFISNKHIMFDIGVGTVFSRLIEGEFINYKGIFPEEFKTTVIIPRAIFSDALDRAALVSYYENKKNPVRMKISNGIVIITTSSETGNSFDEIEADIFGDELEIAFNPKFLIDAVRSIESESISIEFNAPLSPCIIKPVNGAGDCKFLVLPLRLKN